jgi:hypothetical protein
MDEDPQYRMWKDRLDNELALEEARAARRATRELAQTSWHEAWAGYKARRNLASCTGPAELTIAGRSTAIMVLGFYVPLDGRIKRLHLAVE